MPDTYTLLEKVVVGAANATTVTFTSIPQTYTDLVLMCTIRTTGGIQAIDFRFNNDTGSNYSWRYAQGTGTGIDPGTGSGQTVFSEAMVANGSASTANNFSNSTLYIPNYTSSSNKSFSLDTVEEENASNAYSRLESGAWNNTAAITSINLSASGDFVQYSTFYLYGIAKLGVTPTSAPKATGGDSIVTDGTYWIHTFLSSGTFTPTTALSNVDYLVVAGGGGGGNDYYAPPCRTSGGGGAGGLRSTVTATGGGGSLESKLSLLANTGYTVTIGGGGAGGTSSNTVASNGSNSVFSTITSTGGGGGGNHTTTQNYGGASGGSGGGGANSGSGGAGTANQGYNGGNGLGVTAGGGGGAGAQGGAGSGDNTGAAGNGGNGVATAISGSSVTYAGGGGGGGGNNTWFTGAVGTGGTGGGGNGNKTGVGVAGTTNTGGGGGGGRNTSGTGGGQGGSGIVIVRYPV